MDKDRYSAFAGICRSGAGILASAIPQRRSTLDLIGRCVLTKNAAAMEYYNADVGYVMIRAGALEPPGGPAMERVHQYYPAVK